MPLDEIAIRDAKPREKPFKLLDGPWLYLVVSPSGRKFWRLEFHLKGRGRTLDLGDYPDLTPEAARSQRNEALLVIREGRNFHEWKAARLWQRVEAQFSFRAVARDFLAQTAGKWSERRRETSTRWLETYIFPTLGGEPLSQIEPSEVLAEIHKISASGEHKAAASVRALCIQVFRHGISCDACSRAAAAALREALLDQ